jgi:hypothetical protein
MITQRYNSHRVVPLPGGFCVDKLHPRRSCWGDGRQGAQVFRFPALAIAAIFRRRALLIAESLCLRHQLLALHRRHPRPRLSNADRRFRVLASRWVDGWRNSLLTVKPETVLSWQRVGWKAYWTSRSSLRTMRRSAMRVRRKRGPCSSWREFLERHASDIWACDFFYTRTVLFYTLHVAFVIRHSNREFLQVGVTRAAQQIVERRAWNRALPRFPSHDRSERSANLSYALMAHTAIKASTIRLSRVEPIPWLKGA